MPHNLERYREENELVRAGDIDGLENCILEAMETKDVDTVASLVPAQSMLLYGRERRTLVLQAINDWRLAFWDNGAIWRREGFTSAWEMFHHMKTTGDWEKKPKTRLTYANAIQTFMIQLGWDLDMMTLAGIGKMANHYAMVRDHVEERDGEIDPRLEELLLDAEHVSGSRLRYLYQKMLDEEEILEEDYEEDEDSTREPPEWRAWVSATPENGGIQLTRWEPIPSQGEPKWISHKFGVLYGQTPEQLEHAAEFLAGEMKVKGWWKE